MKVEVYWNLHKHVWSIRHKGRVIAHRPSVVIEDGKFVVQPAGNAKVRREGRKNVHAFVRGEWCDSASLADGAYSAVIYNPYKYTSFVEAHSEQPIYSAEVVQLCSDRGCFALTKEGKE